MSPEELLRFVQDLRHRALSPATLSASLNTDSAKIKDRVRGTKTLSVEAAKRKSLLDSI